MWCCGLFINCMRDNKMKNKFLYIMFAIFIILQMNSTIQIGTLKTELQRTKDSITYMEEQLNGNISSIYSNVDNILTQQASIVSICNYQVGEYNIESRKKPITFRLQPK